MTRCSVVVEVAADLEPLVPGYLENRRRDLDRMQALLTAADHAAIARLAHRMKGNGASYGFARLSELGAQLETAAGDADAGAVRALLAALDDYLQALAVRYV